MYSYMPVSKPNRAAVNELLQQMSKFRKSGMYIINRALYSYSLNHILKYIQIQTVSIIKLN